MTMPYVGETRIFAFDFAPAGWMPCDGSLVPISDCENLFQLIGTAYGGDGEYSFALPKAAGPSSGDTPLNVCISLFGAYPQPG
jgi:microcystin-dependent protein